MSEELKLNENVGAPQPDALARIARKDDFLQQLQEFLAQHKGENWCVAAIDLDLNCIPSCTVLRRRAT